MAGRAWERSARVRATTFGGRGDCGPDGGLLCSSSSGTSTDGGSDGGTGDHDRPVTITIDVNGPRRSGYVQFSTQGTVVAAKVT